LRHAHRHAFGRFLFDMVELGCLDVDEHASSPHARLSCIHFVFLLRRRTYRSNARMVPRIVYTLAHMRILVTGGAGYIGSVMTDVLVDGGHDVTVFDNLSRGHRDAISSRAAFVQGDLVDTQHVFTTLKDRGIEAVIHMAGDALVSESMQNPGRYYRNNLIAGISLLEAMRNAGVKPIVFSSTCAV